MSNDTATISTYLILAEHPTNGTMLDVELIATSERAAIARTRGTLFHRDQDVAWMAGTFTVQSVTPGAHRSW